jgi:hypothetical protein
MPPRHSLRLPILAGVVVLVLFLMAISATRDAGPTGLAGDLPNWHNRPGDLARNGGLVLLEAAIAALMLRPSSYRRNWGRSLGVFLIFLPWVVLNVMFLIHSGGIMVIHTFWLLTLWIGCGIAALLPAVAPAGKVREHRAPAA